MKLFGTASIVASTLFGASSALAQATSAPPTPAASPRGAAPGGSAATVPAAGPPSAAVTTPAATPAPLPQSAATASPTPAPAPAPAPAPSAPPVIAAATPPAGTRHVTLSPGHALVHVGVSYRDAWLETRKYVDNGEFVRTCAAPCDITLDVQGLEARVVAPGMTTSNTFRFDSGTGTAGVRVDGGSATARTVGVITLAVGIPVALAGMAFFGVGKVRDDSGLRAAGIVGLAAGGLSIGVSLPLLLIGTTRVRSANGDRIASSFALTPAPN